MNENFYEFSKKLVFADKEAIRATRYDSGGNYFKLLNRMKSECFLKAERVEQPEPEPKQEELDFGGEPASSSDEGRVVDEKEEKELSKKEKI